MTLSAMVRTAFGACICALTLGCADSYVAPDTAVNVPSGITGPTTTSEDVLLRAFFNTGVAFAELNNALCEVSAGGRAVIVSTPRHLTVATAPGTLPVVFAKCTATVGGSSLSANAMLVPTKDDSADRYANGIDVDLQRVRTR